jgi:hypothetical protein
MGEAQNREALEHLLGQGRLMLSSDDEYELRAPDFVLEMPQSGERIVGRDRMRAMQEAFPNPPEGRVRRISGSGDLFVIELVNDYDGDVWHAAIIAEFSDGKLVRETRYYGQPFPAPEWRAAFVEAD